jgi:hypothetical protein
MEIGFLRSFGGMTTSPLNAKMKRSRDEVIVPLDADQQSKKYRQDQFSAYIQHRNRDNSGAVVETNPNRHLNAIFELAFHLHLSKEARETSWLYMDLVRREEVDAPDVREINQIKTLFLRASACIWIAQKATGYSSAFRISTFLTALPKVTQRIMERGHALYQRNHMLPFLQELKSTLDIISKVRQQPEASVKLQQSIEFYHNFADLFDQFMNLFKILITFDRVDYSSVHMCPVPSTPTVEIFRFGWALLIYASTSTFALTLELEMDSNELKSFSIWLVLFIATQIPENLHRTFAQVNQQLQRFGCPQQLVGGTNVFGSYWKSQITQVNDLLSHWFRVEGIHTQVLDKFKDYLDKIKSKGFLVSEEDCVCEYPWRIYRNALDDSQNGLLQVNMQSIIYEIDKESKSFGLEIDLIGFAPTWDRAIATPRRFLRTPGKSIVSRSCSKKVLKSSSQGSSINQPMLFTPFSATSIVGARTPAIEKSTHQMLVDMFKNPINRDQLPEMIQTRFNNALDRIVSKTGSKSKEMWVLSETIYYTLMIRLYSKLEHQDQEFQNALLHDGQFHRCIFCLAFEMVRFAKDVSIFNLVPRYRI